MLLFKKKSKKNDEVDYELPAAYICLGLRKKFSDRADLNWLSYGLFSEAYFEGSAK